jgi:hypothetical protein
MSMLLVLGLVALGGGLLSRQTATGQPIQAEHAEEKAASPKTDTLDNEAASSDEASQKSDEANPRIPMPYSGPKKEARQTEKGQARIVTYSVADLIVPIQGLDIPLNPGKAEPGKTKEDWLISKITRTVSPASWEESGGTGTIQYFPLGMALVVNNTPRVQAQVMYLLETMRRVQEVQVVAETRLLSLEAAGFLKLQQLLPQLKKDRHVVLGELETFALIRKAQDEANTKLTQFPKLTFFPGQRVRLSVDSIDGAEGDDNSEIRLSALVAGDLYHIDLDVKAIVAKVEFTKAVRLVDGTTLAEVRRNGDAYLVLLVTPRVVLNLAEVIHTPEPK